MLKTIRKHGITLALFAAGSTGLTAAINQLTKSTIDEQAALQQKTLFDQVLPGDRYNNNLSESCYLVDAQRWAKVRTVCILPARTIVLLLQFLKLRRQYVIPGRFNCWLVSIFRVPCWVRGLPNIMKRLGWAIKSNCDCPTGSPTLAVKRSLRITRLLGGEKRWRRL